MSDPHRDSVDTGGDGDSSVGAKALTVNVPEALMALMVCSLRHLRQCRRRVLEGVQHRDEQGVVLRAPPYGGEDPARRARYRADHHARQVHAAQRRARHQRHPRPGGGQATTARKSSEECANAG